MLIVCPLCRRQYHVAEKFRGMKTRCLHCHRLFVANEKLSRQISGEDQIISWKNWQNEQPVAKRVMPALLVRPVIVKRSHVEEARQILIPFEDEFRSKEILRDAANEELNRLQQLERSQVRADWVRQNKLWLVLWIGAGFCLLAALSGILVASSVGIGPGALVFVLVSSIGYLASFLGVQVFIASVPSDISATREESIRLSERCNVLAADYRAAEEPYLVAREQYEWFTEAFQDRLNQLLLTNW